MTRQTVVNKIGISNIITIGILVVTLAINYGSSTYKLDAIAQGLKEEIIQRKESDEALRNNFNEKFEAVQSSQASLDVKLDTQFNVLNNNFSELNKNVIYHMGQHGGLPTQDLKK